MKKIINLFVKIEDKSQRVDTFINKNEPALSRNRIKNLILKNKLKINDYVVINPSKKIKPGDMLKFELPEPEITSLKPYNFKLNIVYEDQDILIY